jgi:hypothetical protein
MLLDAKICTKTLPAVVNCKKVSIKVSNHHRLKKYASPLESLILSLK